MSKELLFKKCGKEIAKSETDKFLEHLFVNASNLIKNSWFEKNNLNNKNMMFFLNSCIEKLSNISTMGCRLYNYSLIGEIDNCIKYINDNRCMNDDQGKDFTLSKDVKDYIRDKIIKSELLCENQILRYQYLLDFQNSSRDDEELSYKLNLIKKNLIINKYFETISDTLFDLLCSEETNNKKYQKIELYTNEYLLLLIDYVGISIYEIKNVFKDTFRQFLYKKDQAPLYEIFSSLANSYRNNNLYEVIIKTNHEFDGELLKTLRRTCTQNYTLFSKNGILNHLKNSNIDNKTVLDKIINEIEQQQDNKEYLYAKLSDKDLWKAIKKFKESILQPYLGTLLFAGIRIKNPNDEYIVINKNNNEEEKYISKKKFFSDTYNPLAQGKVDYSLIFQTYILNQTNKNTSEKDRIKEIIDESIQLLPTYNDSTSVLSRFSTIWFALETLYRNANNQMNIITQEYVANLAADKMISGKISMFCIQARKLYLFGRLTCNNITEDTLIKFDKLIYKDCEYMEWKRLKLSEILLDYKKEFSYYLRDSKQLLYTIYRARNKQFHGSKDFQLEYITGHLYDIVNETISFYIDYLNVYKNDNPNMKELFTQIKDISFYKKAYLDNENDEYRRYCILYDSIRKI